MTAKNIGNSETNNPVSDSLGRCLDHYPVRNQNIKRWSLLVIGISLILFSAGFTFIRFFRIIIAIERHGRAILLNQLPVLVLLLCLVIPAGMIMIIVSRRHWSDGITLYENGLIRHNGKQKCIWSWLKTTRLDTRVVHVKFGGSVISTSIKLILEHKPTDTLIIRGHYANLNDLIETIRKFILPILYSRACKRLSDWECLEFNGNLSIIRNGIQLKDSFTPWHQLAEPVLKNGKLMLFKNPGQEKIYQASIRQINNLDLFLHLLKNPPL